MESPIEREDRTQVISAQRVRQAAPLGVMRYVLTISVGLAVLAGVVIWLAFFA